MKLTLGFSPCPNDTFIFDALVNNKIDTEGLSFDVVMDDVETLNRRALEGRLHITKVSYALLPLVLDKYIVLNSGSALGNGVGPILISNPLHHLKGETGEDISEVENSIIAIPGEHTTAHMLFSLVYPKAKQKIFLRYDEIENFVAAGKGLGVIIHENRFTYEQKGLIKIIDLGGHWEIKTKHPIPLGGIVAKRSLDDKIKMKVDRLIRQSIAHAWLNYPQLNDYVRGQAQEMSEDVMRKHIELYVNNYSTNLGEAGKNAVVQLLNISENTTLKGIKSPKEIFLQD